MRGPPSRRRPPARLLAATAALALLALAAAAAGPQAPPRAAPDPAGLPGQHPWQRPGWQLAQDDAGPGAELYLRSCASCHGVDGAGSQRGPALVGVGGASVHFQLSTGRMPLEDERDTPQRGEPAFTPEEIDALVRHVAGFGGGGPPIPVLGPGDIHAGRSLYLSTCAACHSSTGAGGILTLGRIVPPLYRATPVQVAEAIRVGPGAMPAFPEGVFDDREVDAITAYVDVLQDERGEMDPGGAPLGRIGPFTEGLVGVFIGLLLVVLVARWLGSRAG